MIQENKRLCKVCSSAFHNTNGRATLCSDKCKDEQKRRNNVSSYRAKNTPIDVNDTVTCEICKCKFKTLSSHLREHDITAEEYKLRYPNANIVSVAYSVTQSKNFSGENNPGFNHGGTLSPWSKLSGRTAEQVTLSKQNAKINRTKEKQNTSLEFWTSKGYTPEEAMALRKDRQLTFSLAGCVEKYGENMGAEIFLSRQQKWQLALTSKSDDEIAAINQKKAWSKGATSGIEIALVDGVSTQIPDIKRNCQIDSRINVDIAHGKKVVELFGDYWHMNPNKYPPTFINASSKLMASIKWEKDKVRLQKIQDLGFEVKIVWEHDFKQDPDKIIKECVEFLNG